MSPRREFHSLGATTGKAPAWVTTWYSSDRERMQGWATDDDGRLLVAHIRASGPLCTFTPP